MEFPCVAIFSAPSPLIAAFSIITVSRERGNSVRHRARSTVTQKVRIQLNDVITALLTYLDRAQQGRSRQSYLSMLLKEVGTNSKEELRTLMRDSDIWRGISGVDRT